LGEGMGFRTLFDQSAQADFTAWVSRGCIIAKCRMAPLSSTAKEAVLAD
jgi:hypothetical protein